MAAGAATLGAVLGGGQSLAYGQDDSEGLTKGDIAILRFVARG
jgi:hypothetical protein